MIEHRIVSLVERLGAADSGIVDKEIDAAEAVEGMADDVLWCFIGSNISVAVSVSSLAGSRPTPTTAIPAACSITAVASPIPLPAPVIIATCIACPICP
jgi:hypothetical protein